MKSSYKISLICLVVAGLAGVPTQIRAQDTNMPSKHAVEKKATKETKETTEKLARKPGVTPFHGKLKAVDKNAKTITVGKTTVQITSDTKILKDGKPATLTDAVVGEQVGGAYKKADDGKLNATKIHFGAKPEAATEGEDKKVK